MDVKKLSEYLGIRDNRAFSMLLIAGFSAILVGAVFLIISILVVNSLNTAVGTSITLSGPYGNQTSSLNTTYSNVMTSIGQALVIAGVSLIVVGVAVIIAVLFGMVGGGGFGGRR
jgi:hypothetical protein